MFFEMIICMLVIPFVISFIIGFVYSYTLTKIYNQFENPTCRYKLYDVKQKDYKGTKKPWEE